MADNKSLPHKSMRKKTQNVPRHAIILAAGFGTRLRPLSNVIPKPLVPLWGIPMLEHSINTLAQWGVRDILINLHYSAGKIVRHITNSPPRNIRINFSFEPEIQGTGGALRNAGWFIENRGPFWLINSDVAMDLDPQPLINAFTAKTKCPAIAALWLEPSRGPRTVQYAAGQIKSFNTPNPGADNTATFTGLHLLHPRILKYIPQTGPASIITAYGKARHDKCSILAVTIPESFWADVGNMDDYLAAHERSRTAALKGQCGAALYRRENDLSQNKNTSGFINGWTAVTQDQHLIKSVQLNNCVLLKNSSVSNCRLRRTVAAPGVCVKRDAEGIVIKAKDCPGRKNLAWALQRLQWSPSETLFNALPARGSDRIYSRLINERKSVILVEYSAQRSENARMVHHSRFLSAKGINLPRILANAPKRRAYLTEDAGIKDLRDVISTRQAATIQQYYRPVMKMLAHLHRLPYRKIAGELEPPFDAELYYREHTLFIDCFLKPYTKSAENIKTVLKELKRVSQLLLTAPQVLIHRDMQSSNVLWHSEKPLFIDFQGMRAGAAAYDVASLLCDPYVMLDEKLQKCLLRDYIKFSGSEDTAKFFWHAAIQRLVQALGAFGRFGRDPVTRRFLDYAPDALLMLKRAINNSGLQLPHLLSICRNLN